MAWEGLAGQARLLVVRSTLPMLKCSKTFAQVHRICQH